MNRLRSRIWRTMKAIPSILADSVDGIGLYSVVTVPIVVSVAFCHFWGLIPATVFGLSFWFFVFLIIGIESEWDDQTRADAEQDKYMETIARSVAMRGGIATGEVRMVSSTYDEKTQKGTISFRSKAKGPGPVCPKCDGFGLVVMDADSGPDHCDKCNGTGFELPATPTPAVEPAPLRETGPLHLDTPLKPPTDDPSKCHRCRGRGAIDDPGTWDMMPCPACKGMGRTSPLPSPSPLAVVCPYCEGFGRVPMSWGSSPCSNCNHNGWTE